MELAGGRSKRPAECARGRRAYRLGKCPMASGQAIPRYQEQAAEDTEPLHAGPSRVVRLRPRSLAAPRSPLTRQPVSSRMATMCRRSTSSRFRSCRVGPPPTSGAVSKLAEVEAAIGGEDHRPLDYVLQLAHVAGPGVGRQSFQHLRAPQVLSHLRGVVHGEMPGQARHVIRPLSQRGDDDGKDVETVVEVSAEALLGYGTLEIPIGGRDQPYVDLQGPRSADALELTVLQDAQELGPHSQGEVPDLVEEERAAVGQLEAADLHAEGTGEGPFFVAEHLALDHSRRQGGTVDLDQGPCAGSDHGWRGARSAPSRYPSRQ